MVTFPFVFGNVRPASLTAAGLTQLRPEFPPPSEIRAQMFLRQMEMLPLTSGSFGFNEGVIDAASRQGFC